MKSFTPKVDKKRRLVLTRIYAGVKGSNVYLYKIHRINKLDQIDKRFKPLFAFGSDDFKNIEHFQHSQTGEIVKVPKTTFKSVFGVADKNNPVEIWSKQK